MAHFWRIKIGLKLVKSAECGAFTNGACYPIPDEPLFLQLKKGTCQSIKIEKMTVEQAISLYQDRLPRHKLFLTDIDVMLGEKLNLGTWVSYFADEQWCFLHEVIEDDDLT